MRSPLAFLKFAAEIVLDAVGFGVAGKLVVDVIPSVAEDLWNCWGKDRPEEELRAEIQAVAVASDGQVAAVVEEVAVGRPAEARQFLSAFLKQVPATIRSVSRRPEDPSGRAIDPRRPLRCADDLVPLLPVRLPQFVAGQRAPGFGDWELVELLGVGGFGEVWKARNPHMDSEPPVAIKFCQSPDAEATLKNESRLLNRVKAEGTHEGIVKLLDTALNSKPPALKYEYVAGGDLAGLINRWRTQPPTDHVGETVRILHELAGIVGYMHLLKPDPIVHRDLKPANVLLMPHPEAGRTGPRLRVADFGIGGIAARRAAEVRHSTTKGAFLTEALRGACTIMYASPQQRLGKSPTPRDDVFSIGVIGYQMLLADLMAEPGTDFADVLAERKVPQGLIGLLGRCLAGTPTNRLADAGVVAAELTSLFAIEPPKRTTTSVDPAKVEIVEATIAPLRVDVPTLKVDTPQQADLPALPADILELEGKLAGLTQAIQALEAGSHPALEAARQAIAVAERQTRTLRQDLEANTPELPAAQQKALADGVVKDLELSNIVDLCELVPELPTRVLTPYLRRLRNVELARRAEVSAREQFGQRVREQTANLRKQSKDAEERLACRRQEDLRAVMFGFFERVGAVGVFPLEAWESLEPKLEQRRYGITDRAMLGQAQKLHGEWKTQREHLAATAKVRAEQELEALLLAAYERGKGTLATADARAVNELHSRGSITTQRAQAIAADVLARWKESKQLRPGSLLTLDLGGIELKLAYIPPGSFLMGSPASEEGRFNDEGPQHTVTLTKGFYLGVYPVTQAQWKAVAEWKPSSWWQRLMGTGLAIDPSHFKGANRPVESVSWHNCQEFCRQLSEKTGRKFRLPTEAEWEYACRAGTTTAYHTGNSEDALKRAGWYSGNSGSQTHLVGEKEANAWGLHDMHGNVWEWCWDAKRGYTSSTMKDPLCDGSARVVRGGSWDDVARGCRAASRCCDDPGNRYGNIGCRVVYCLD